MKSPQRFKADIYPRVYWASQILEGKVVAVIRMKARTVRVCVCVCGVGGK